MGLAGVVVISSMAYLYVNHSSLPWPGRCHGSGRCGGDIVIGLSLWQSQFPTLTWKVSWVWQVWWWYRHWPIFMTITVPYLDLAGVMGLAGVVVILSLAYLYNNHSSLPWPGRCHRSGRCGGDIVIGLSLWQSQFPTLTWHVSWVWQVWCWQCHCFYLHHDGSPLPCPVTCHSFLAGMVLIVSLSLPLRQFPVLTWRVSWVGQVWYWQYHCSYLSDDGSSLPCDGKHQESSRGGSDSVICLSLSLW